MCLYIHTPSRRRPPPHNDSTRNTGVFSTRDLAQELCRYSQRKPKFERPSQQVQPVLSTGGDTRTASHTRQKENRPKLPTSAYTVCLPFFVLPIDFLLSNVTDTSFRDTRPPWCQRELLCWACNKGPLDLCWRRRLFPSMSAMVVQTK